LASIFYNGMKFMIGTGLELNPSGLWPYQELSYAPLVYRLSAVVFRYTPT